MNSDWYTLIITFVPLDLDELQKHLKKSGVKVNKDYL